MNNYLGNRYLLERLVQPLSGGMLYTGKDLSLQRPVFLYLVENKGDAFGELYLRMLGQSSRFSNDRFMHILDAGLNRDHIYVVLNYCDGKPLLQDIKHHTFTSREIVASVLALGEAIQDAMEEDIAGFSVTAENLWVTSDRQLMVIDYWSGGGANSHGAMGLCGLLYQLGTRSEIVPVQFETYRQNLQAASPRDLTDGQKEAAIAMARSVFAEQGSLSFCLLRLREMMGAATQPHTQAQAQPAIERPAFAAASPARTERREKKPAADMAAKSPREPATINKKWLVANVSLIVVIIVVVAMIINGRHKPDRAETASTVPAPPVQSASQTPQAAGTPADKPAEPADKPNPNAPSSGIPAADSAANGETVAVPNLVGLTRQDAEKLVRSVGLHYEYFLENNEQTPGTVFKQEPKPDTQVPKDGNVKFWVSRETAR